MSDIRNLVGSEVIDVEINTMGFIVLYFQDENGDIYSIDLQPAVRKLDNEGIQIRKMEGEIK